MPIAVSRGWTLLLPVAPGTRVLELSGDQGIRARSLADAGARVTCIRELESDVLALKRVGFDAFTPSEAVAELPLQHFDAAWISLAEARTYGDEFIARHWDGLVAGVAAQLRPGGTLVVSLKNPLFALPGLAGLLARLTGDERPGGSPARGGLPRAFPGLRAIRERIEGAGFDRVRAFLPLPSAARPKFLVPLDDPRVLAYFFDQLAPPGQGRAQRLALSGAAWSARHGLLARLAPEYEIAARRRDA